MKQIFQVHYIAVHYYVLSVIPVLFLKRNVVGKQQGVPDIHSIAA